MKIASSDKTFIIPLESNHRNIISIRDDKNELIDYLYSYFVTNKKTKCIIYDDEYPIKQDELAFVYISNEISFESNLNFKTKSLTNSIITEIIRNNPELFISLDRIREEIYNFQTDSGLIKIKKILSKGLEKNVEISLNSFDYNSWLQMFSVTGEYTNSQIQIMLLNLLLYENRTKTNLVFIDKYIDEELIDWIESQENNSYFFLDNNFLYFDLDNYDLLLLSNSDHVIFEEETNNNIQRLSYMQHPIIKSHLSLQNEKNIELFNHYNDNNSTFFIKNISY